MNSRSILPLGIVFAVTLVTLVAAGLGGMVIIDIARSYATGESEYSKAQKSAVLALHRYASSRDPADFAEYARLIEVPINDRRAREVLEDHARPRSDSHEYLEGGGNHPDDVPGMAWLFRTFGDTALFAAPIDVWRQGDLKIAALDEMAHELDALIRSATVSDAAVAAHLRRIDQLDDELTLLANEFSEGIGHAARTLGSRLQFGLGGLGMALAMLGGVFAFSTMRRLEAAARDLRDREARFRDVADVAGDWIWETDAEFRTRYVSDRVEAVTGHDKSAFLGHCRWELGASPITTTWAEHIAAMERHDPIRNFRYAFTDSTGRKRVFSINGKAAYAGDGTFLGYRGTGTDVTAEVEALREADRRRELLETVFENLGQGVSVVDADLVATMFNRRFLDLLDFPADRFSPGDPFERFIRFNAERSEYGEGDIEDLVLERLAKAQRFEPHRYERTRPDGTVIEIHGQPLPSGGFVTTYRDVTAERRLQIALKASERRTRAVVEGALDAVVTTDQEGRITEFNPAAETMFGVPRERAIGKPLAELIIPERYRAQHRVGMARYLASGETRVIGRRVELCALRSDGSEFPVELAIVANMTSEGVTFIGFLRDITARNEMDAARKAAEERLWAIMDGSPEAITLKDMEDRYLLCNAAFERLVGHSRDEILGRTSEEVLRNDDAIRTEIVGHEQRVIETRLAVREERDICDHDGHMRTMAIIKFPVIGAGGEVTGIGTISQDITDLKNAESQLRQALKMQAVGQLTGGVAHDFNNLLAVVLGNLELLHERLAETPALARLAEQAIEAGWRGAKTTRRLLAFSRQQPLQPQPVDVPQLLETMADLVRQSLGETIGFKVESTPDPWRCMADPAELETAILNLALNARDAMPDGGSFTIKVANVEIDDDGPAENAGLQPGQYVMLAVSDTGTGMTPKILERVFEPFFTTKAVDKGSGLGLSMVHGFVHQSGGHVAIDSEPGAGTTVRLYLPRAAGEVSTPEVCDPRSATVASDSERILVVEDNDLVRAHATSQLESLGYTVVAVPDASAALAALEHDGAFDLLFTDVVMPGGMSGLGLAETVRQSRPDQPVLLTSGYNEADALVGKGPTAQFELLQKPYRRQQLAERVRAALGRSSDSPSVPGDGSGDSAATGRAVMVRRSTRSAGVSA